jgi:hypothetical protein
MGFEPRISVFERAKTVHALDGAATVIGKIASYRSQKQYYTIILDKPHRGYKNNTAMKKPQKGGYIHICEERIVTIPFKNTTSRTGFQTTNTMEII